MNPIISPGGQFPSGSFFSTPDQVQDFAPPYHESSWSAYVSRIVDTKAAEGGVRFYNPTRIVPTAQPALAEISWSIFPQRLMGLTDEARWAEADRNFSRRDTQDEYCEWSVERNAEGKLIKVVFTCEMPEVKQSPLQVGFAAEICSSTGTTSQKIRILYFPYTVSLILDARLRLATFMKTADIILKIGGIKALRRVISFTCCIKITN